MTRARWLSALAVALAVGGCSIFGASEITVDARNDSDLPMTVQVIEGFGDDGAIFGPEHVLDPLEERALELAVPAGEWTVTVNGAQLVGSADAACRRGRMPVTLIVPAIDAPMPGPYWEAAGDWLQTGPP